MGFIRYQRDLPTLRYHFSKLTEEQRKEMAEGRAGPGSPYYERAWAKWLADYALPEFWQPRVHQGAALDFMRALKKGRVPNWVLSAAPFEEIQQVAAEAEGVRE